MAHKASFSKVHQRNVSQGLLIKGAAKEWLNIPA
jgi:hypothetical protein